MKPVHVSLEPNSSNTDAAAVVLYFEQEPTQEQVLQALSETKLVLSVDVDDEFFNYEERPTALSNRAGLRRYECHPTV